MKLTKNAQDSPQKYIQVKWILFSVPGTLWVDEDIEKVWKYGKSSAGHLKKPPTYLSQSIFLESHCFRHLFESLSLRQSQAWNFKIKNVATFLAFTQPRTRNRKKPEEWNFPGISSPVVQFSKFISRSARPHFIPIFFLQPRPLDAPSSSLCWSLLELSKNFFMKQNALA